MISSVLGMLFAMAVVIAAGSGSVGTLSTGTPSKDVGAWPERSALILLLGFGYISIALFALGFLFSGAALIGVVTAGAIALYVVSRFRPAPTLAVEPVAKVPITVTEWIFVGILCVQALFIFWTVVTYPLGWDGLTIWEMKAQIAFANDGRLPAEYFRDATRSWSHVHYPLYWPYAETWLYLCMGGVDQGWVRSLGGIFYVAALGLIAGAVTRLGGTRLAGLIAASLLFFLPILTAMPAGVFSGYADFPLAVLYLAAVCRLPFWDSPFRTTNDRLLAVLAMLVVWTKTEGKILFGALLLSAAFVVTVRGRQWRRLIVIATPAILLLIVHAAFLRHVGALQDKNYASPTPQNLIAHVDRAAPVAKAIGTQFLNLKNWSLLWPGALLALVTLASCGKPRTALQLTAVLALPLPAYGLAYLLSTWPDYERHIHTSLSRLLLGLAPVALLAIGLAIPRFSRRAARA